MALHSATVRRRRLTRVQSWPTRLYFSLTSLRRLQRSSHCSSVTRFGATQGRRQPWRDSGPTRAGLRFAHPGYLRDPRHFRGASTPRATLSAATKHTPHTHHTHTHTKPEPHTSTTASTTALCHQYGVGGCLLDDGAHTTLVSLLSHQTRQQRSLPRTPVWQYE
jgi:hypothetical protein